MITFNQFRNNHARSIYRNSSDRRMDRLNNGNNAASKTNRRNHNRNGREKRTTKIEGAPDHSKPALIIFCSIFFKDNSTINKQPHTTNLCNKRQNRIAGSVSVCSRLQASTSNIQRALVDKIKKRNNAKQLRLTLVSSLCIDLTCRIFSLFYV